MNCLAWGVRGWNEATTRTEECHELLEEVKAADLRAEEWKAQAMSLARLLNETVDENISLSVQLDQWEAARTTGGVHRGYMDANWTNIAAPQVESATDESAPPLVRKFNKMPPPHSPAISTEQVQT